MTYFISGSTQMNSKLYVINNDDGSIETNKNISAGNYESDVLSSGTKTVIGITDDGTSVAYGNVMPVDNTNNYLEVGSGKTYSTIIDAYNAAVHNDTILIYPGNYDATGTMDFSGKRVNFRGVGDVDSIVITSDIDTSTNFFNIDTPGFTIIENITFTFSGTYSWRIIAGFSVTNTESTLLLNKCKLQVGSGTNFDDRWAFHQDNSVGTTIFRNCYIERGYSTFYLAGGHTILDHTELNSTTIDYYQSNPGATFDIERVVSTPSIYSFGTDYGKFYVNY